ncbi:nuclear transport factor 2 family protein [Sulfurovum sp. zt1-1]|uniref:Nuclear transport factor 2 family protein n=1 Tax=Sulfurovum zhangzhouensis TaxID=3019067 RepID=A0ABT7QVP9_9BACT|nr:nuclear transport factor 2 family protein [Sulfurovum zhangzhouensis]MDM5270918.1 nuclear transport factor 2 family protein [Sulfurovum zhangzhouensis]
MNKVRLKTFFETIDTEAGIDDFKSIYAKEVHFIDPLCELNDVGAVYRFFQQIYQKVDTPNILISESLSEGEITYVKWSLTSIFKIHKRNTALMDKPYSF